MTASLARHRLVEAKSIACFRRNRVIKGKRPSALPSSDRYGPRQLRPRNNERAAAASIAEPKVVGLWWDFGTKRPVWKGLSDRVTP
jgi:hypothetical protein